MKRIVSAKKLVPPIISSLMESLYTSGILKFHCVVFQCVGYDHATYNEAMRMKEKTANIVPIPGAAPSISTTHSKWHGLRCSYLHNQQTTKAKARGPETTMVESPRRTRNLDFPSRFLNACDISSCVIHYPRIKSWDITEKAEEESERSNLFRI